MTAGRVGESGLAALEERGALARVVGCTSENVPTLRLLAVAVPAEAVSVVCRFCELPPREFACTFGFVGAAGVVAASGTLTTATGGKTCRPA